MLPEKSLSTRRDSFLFFLSVHILVLYIASCIYGHNYMYAEGSEFLCNILRNSGFAQGPADGIFGQILMQSFSVAAISLGVTSVQLISILFGFGATFFTGLFYYLSMRLCLLRKKPEYMALISSMLCLLLLFTGFFAQQTSTLSAAIFCYLFFSFLLYEEGKKPVQIISKIFLILCALLSLRMSAFFLVYSPILILTLAYKCFRKEIRPTWYLFLHIILQGVVIYFAVVSGSEKTFSDLAKSTGDIWRNYNLFLVFGLLFVVLLYAFTRFNHAKLKEITIVRYLLSDSPPKGKLVIPSILLSAVILLIVYYQADSIAENSVNIHVVNLVIPVILFVIVLLMQLLKFRLPRLPIIEFALIIAVALFLVLSSHSYRQKIPQISDDCLENTEFVFTEDGEMDTVA